MTLRELLSAWNQFWFGPTTAAVQALIRIAAGLLVCETLILLVGQDLLDWYGYRAIVTPESIKQFWWQGAPHFDLLLFLPHNDGAVLAFFWVFLIAAIFMTIGLQTRWSTLIVALGLISFNNQMPFNVNGGDEMLRFIVLYLVFSECGAVISADRLIRRFKHPMLGVNSAAPSVPIFGQRLIQVQMALAYGATTITKLSGAEWLDGSAVYYALRLEQLCRFSIPFLTDNLLANKALSLLTLIVEGSMCTLVWIRDLRYWVLASAVALHLSIDVFMNLPVFQWVFITGLISFVYPDDLSDLMNRFKSWISLRYGPPSAVIYNPAIARHLSWASVLEGIDIFGRLRMEPTEGVQRLTTVRKNDKITGMRLIAFLAPKLPLLWPIYPLMLLSLMAIDRGNAPASAN